MTPSLLLKLFNGLFICGQFKLSVKHVLKAIVYSVWCLWLTWTHVFSWSIGSTNVSFIFSKTGTNQIKHLKMTKNITNGIPYRTLVMKLWKKYSSKTLCIWLLLSLEPNCVTGLEWSIFLILFYILVTRFARQLLQSEFELEMCKMQNDLQPIRHNWGILMLPFLILTLRCNALYQNTLSMSAF